MNNLINALAGINTDYVWVHIIWLIIMLIIVVIALMHTTEDTEKHSVQPDKVSTQSRKVSR